MKIIIAPDSFKGSLSAAQAAVCIERGVRRVLPAAHCTLIPIADGGEGTARAMLTGLGGRWRRKKVRGPLDAPVNAAYAMLRQGQTAVVEVAAASGLTLLRRGQYDVWRASSYGTGQLLADAVRHGARHVIIGVGGSATCDGGCGAAQALGVRFYDRSGKLMHGPLGGGALHRIRHIDVSGMSTIWRSTRVSVACDVDNPLCGPRGTVAVFAPQKGATRAMAPLLERNMRHLQKLFLSELNCDVRLLVGAGAAGGLGAGLAAMLGARLYSGTDMILRAVDLQRVLRDADLVITGEGCMDTQTLHGKAPFGVAAMAGKQRVPVIGIGGVLAADAHHLYCHGISGLASSVSRCQSVDEAIADAGTNLSDAAERAMRLIVTGRNMSGSPSRLHRRR